ncbi:type B 50S ribosomal protein L31 [Candidatus Neptunochlamydia vexilliferae]|nr:type B 50S ribosomal protein L31 [Candidatus Neptunochlamydia vexilliferae]
MKKEGHPAYQDILFVDTATGDKFVCGSTLQPKETETFEGKEYPVYKVPISSASHPFFTGSQQFVDSEGRVDKFKKRYTRKAAENKQEQEKQDEQKKKKTAKKTTAKKTAKKKAAPKE